MAKIKTSEADSPVLDWAVAKQLGFENNRFRGVIVEPGHGLGGAFPKKFRPSTDWSQGGPIVDLEKIQCTTLSKGEEWRAAMIYGMDCIQYGPTLLIAAMRCFVTAKMGPVIEVPDELLAQQAVKKHPKP